MADIIYYVNEELGTVVAKMPTFEDDFYREITAFCQKQFKDKSVWFSSGCVKLFTTKTSELLHGKYQSAFVNLCGKAHCNYEHGESFNIDKGKELAKQRLMVKVFNLRQNIFNDLFNFMEEEIMDAINEKVAHYELHLLMYKLNVESLEKAY
jgi:hypothetical protein